MRIYENEKLVKIICNQCGKAHVVTQEGIHSEYLQVEKSWGYFSDKDGEHHRFDLCEECYDRLLAGFRIPASKAERTELL